MGILGGPRLSNPVHQVLSLGATGARFTPDDGPVIEVGGPSAHRTVLAVPDDQGLLLGWLEVWFDVLPSPATQTALGPFVATIGAWSASRARRPELANQLDEATGLLNGRGFDHQARHALHQAQADDDVAVVFAVLEPLDPQTDLHDHEHEPIVALARAIDAVVRRSDVVARIAEDGCAAFLRDCDHDTAPSATAALQTTP